MQKWKNLKFNDSTINYAETIQLVSYIILECRKIRNVKLNDPSITEVNQPNRNGTADRVRFYVFQTNGWPMKFSRRTVPSLRTECKELDIKYLAPRLRHAPFFSTRSFPNATHGARIPVPRDSLLNLHQCPRSDTRGLRTRVLLRQSEN